MLSHPTFEDTEVARARAYPEGQTCDPAGNKRAMALLALSHTRLEHRLYLEMLNQTHKTQTREVTCSVSQLRMLPGTPSYSSIRRACAGLLQKQSIERVKAAGRSRPGNPTYLIFSPEEIFNRRLAMRILPYPRELLSSEQEKTALGAAIEKVSRKNDRSRREAQVAVRCAQGLTNAEIGRKLFICQETVKFHLRNIFVKFGVSRRTELIARLLTS